MRFAATNTCRPVLRQFLATKHLRVLDQQLVVEAPAKSGLEQEVPAVGGSDFTRLAT